MKRLAKIVLVLASVILLIGVGLCVGGMVMGASADDLGVDISVEHIGMGESAGSVRDYVKNIQDFVADIRDGDEDWGSEEWDGEWEEEHHLVSPVEDSDSARIYQAEPPEKMEIELCSDELIMEQYDGDGVRVEVEGDDHDNVRVMSKEDKLSIKSINVQRGRTITLYYPSSLQLKELELYMDAGEVYLEDDLAAHRLEINVGAGEFTADGKITADEAEFEVGAGELFLELLDTRRLDGECGMGDMELTLAGSAKDYNCDLECGIGSISLGEDEYSGLAREKKIRNKGAGREICLECGIGEIVVSFEND